MKKLIFVIATVFGLMFATTGWSHHAAEGIVADETYDMISEQLDGTPHLELTLDDLAIRIIFDVDNEDLGEVEDIMDEVLVNRGSPNIEVEYVDNGDGTTTVIVTEPIGAGVSQEDMADDLIPEDPPGPGKNR